MPDLHQLTCERAGCGRAFSAVRSDAKYCSRRCRRAKLLPASPGDGLSAAEDNAEAQPEVVEDELDGWRLMPGGYLAPPPDPRNTFTVW